MQPDIDNATKYRKFIKNGNTKDAKSLILGLTEDEINELGRDGKTFLALAVENGNNDVVAHLLENGADPNKPNKDENTPFVIAFDIPNKGKKKSEIAKTLLKGGLDVNSEHNTTTGKTKPIHIATALGSNELVKFISSLQGVSIDEHNIAGKPIEIAIRNCNFYMTEILVNAGANLSNANQTTGYKPIHFAIDSLSFSKKILNFLLKQGCVDYLTENEEKKPLFTLPSARKTSKLSSFFY
jgi:ankyrin repeat protein